VLKYSNVQFHDFWLMLRATNNAMGQCATETREIKR